MDTEKNSGNNGETLEALSFPLNEKSRKMMQHHIKIYMEKYFKHKLGKGVEHTQITIWNDLMVIRGERFLTDPEKYIVKTETGRDYVRESRMFVCKQHSIDNLPYFERIFRAKVIHEAYDINPEQDLWIHVIVFDHVLTMSSD